MAALVTVEFPAVWKSEGSEHQHQETAAGQQQLQIHPDMISMELPGVGMHPGGHHLQHKDPWVGFFYPNMQKKSVFRL